MFTNQKAKEFLPRTAVRRRKASVGKDMGMAEPSRCTPGNLPTAQPSGEECGSTHNTEYSIAQKN